MKPLSTSNSINSRKDESLANEIESLKRKVDFFTTLLVGSVFRKFHHSGLGGEDERHSVISVEDENHAIEDDLTDLLVARAIEKFQRHRRKELSIHRRKHEISIPTKLSVPKKKRKKGPCEKSIQPLSFRVCSRDPFAAWCAMTIPFRH
jgi:hypothetical protein